MARPRASRDDEPAGPWTDDEPESERRFRELYENLRDGFAAVSLGGTIVAHNPAFAEMIGYSSEEVRSLTYEQITPERWHAAEARIIEEQVLVRGYSDLYEKEYVRKDGTVVPVELQTYLSRDRNGSPTGMWAFVRDTTKRKRVAAEKEALETQLRRSQKLEAIGQLAGGVAHDFNNILTGILGSAELALLDLRAGRERSRVAERIDEIRHNAMRAGDLTRQLLAFGQGQPHRPQPLDLNGTVLQMERLLRRLITENISLEVTFAPGLRLVRADPSQIEQVVLNLVINARDAIKDRGSIGLSLSNLEPAEERTATGEGAPSGPGVLLEVRDDGCGMDRATLERIFEPFFTTKGPRGGTGLGLSTVYGIVKQAGGQVRVESEVGRGTSFRVVFPAAAEVDEAPHAAAPEEGSPSGRETVLLCEDDELLRRIASQILTSAGYQVVATANGADALERARELDQRPDLLVTDVVMPGIGGAELARTLVGLWPDLPVLYVSGHPEEVLREHGLTRTATDLVLKPFARATLLRRVRALLDGPR